jgi:hypothetical protein
MVLTMTDFAAHKESQQRSSGSDWTLSLALGLVVLAGGLAVAKAFGEGPANLQRGSHTRTAYVAVLTYEYGAFPFTVLLLLASVLITVVALRRLRQPTGQRTAWVALGATSLALLWAGWNTLPQLFVGYQHLASVTVGAEQYQLGLRTALDGDDYFVVSRCQQWLLNCDAYGVAPIAPEERSALDQVRLEPEPVTKTLAIRTAARSIPVTLPLP